MKPMDPVFDLLVSATAPDSDGTAQDLAMPADDAAWVRLAQLSQLHSVEPLVAPLALGSRTCPDVILDFFGRIQQETQLIRKANILSQAEVTDACRARGIPLILLKGAGLAERFFKDPSAYCSRDIDLLARPRDLPGVEEVLRDLGFTSYNDDYYRQNHFHTVWMHNRRSIGGHVELHWDVSLVQNKLKIPLADWWSRAPEIKLAAGPVLVPPQMDEVPYLAWHTLLAGSARLRELGVWARAFQALGADISMDDLRQQARDARIGGFLARAAILAHGLWGIDTRGCELDVELDSRWRRLSDIALAPDLVVRAGHGTWPVLKDLAYWSMSSPGGGGLWACSRQSVEGRLQDDPPGSLPLRLVRSLRYTADFWRVLALVFLRGPAATRRLGENKY